MTLLNGDQHEIGAYVREMADLMGLRDWTVQTDVADNVEITNHRYVRGNPGASSLVIHGRRAVTVTLRSDWPEWDASDMRQTIAHELVHAHVVVMVWAFNNVQAVIGSTALFEMADSAFDDAHELAVDAIATAWAETLPLPVKEAVRDAA